jgi:hypothetical protein
VLGEQRLGESRGFADQPRDVGVGIVSASVVGAGAVIVAGYDRLLLADGIAVGQVTPLSYGELMARDVDRRHLCCAGKIHVSGGSTT